MADIDPQSIPFVPPTDVALIDTESGKPKTAFHDWMQSLYDFVKRSVVDLTTKITTLIDTTGETTAEVEQITQALTDGTGAYGSYITTINAKANNATASGQMYFAAKAAPSGATSAFGLYLTAGGSYAGFEAMAVSGGGSAIGMTASQFYFTDSGTAQQVLTYSSGVFIFNVPIVIRNASSGARQEITSSNTKIYDASNVLRVAMGTGI